MVEDWRQRVGREIRSIKKVWSDRYGWAPEIREPNPDSPDGPIDLYVRFTREKKAYVLRLRYEKDFETAGRREAFVEPDDYSLAASTCWPQGIEAIKASHQPPAICLEGTWGFHSVLHKERDGRVANINKLLMELQRCMTKS